VVEEESCLHDADAFVERLVRITTMGPQWACLCGGKALYDHHLTG
jgi:hypothetical protein